jgi:hypothetical protein
MVRSSGVPASIAPGLSGAAMMAGWTVSSEREVSWQPDIG